jgi:ADP-heptose:LPS heptosyltransferase
VKILAIRFARLGDIVLLLPALSSLKAAFSNAELTFLTGHRCAPVAELCPAIDEVISVDRIAMRDGSVLSAFNEMAKLARDIRRRRFDLVIDFHSFRETNLLAWLSGAPSRLAMKRNNASYWGFCFTQAPVVENKSLHVAEVFQRVVDRGAGQPSPGGGSGLVIPDNLRAWAKQAAPGGSRLALYIDAPAPERIWPPERFAEIADYAIEKFGAAIMVLSSNLRIKHADLLQRASRNPDLLTTFTNVGIPELAALIASARLLVSNDTGPMHLGPAVGVPTLGLFSVGYPEHFRPTGPSDRFLRGNPIETIEMRHVVEAVDQMWTTADRDLRY